MKRISRKLTPVSARRAPLIVLSLLATLSAVGCRTRATGSQAMQAEEATGSSSGTSPDAVDADDAAWASTRLWYRFVMGGEYSGVANLDGTGFYVNRIRDYGDERHPDVQNLSQKYKYDAGDMPKFEETFPLCVKTRRVPGTTALKLRVYGEPCANVSAASQPLEEFDLKLEPYDYYPTWMSTKPQIVKSRALITKTIDGKVFEVGDVGSAHAKYWRSSPAGAGMYSIKSVGVLTQIVQASRLLGNFSLPDGSVFTETHDEKVSCGDALIDGAAEPVVFQVNHLCTGPSFGKACSLVLERGTWKPKRIDFLDDQAFDASVLSCSQCYATAGKFFYSRRTTRNSGMATGASDSLEMCEELRARDAWCQNNRDVERN